MSDGVQAMLARAMHHNSSQIGNYAKRPSNNDAPFINANQLRDEIMTNPTDTSGTLGCMPDDRQAGMFPPWRVAASITFGDADICTQQCERLLKMLYRGE